MNHINSVLSRICDTRQHAYLKYPMISSKVFTPQSYLAKATSKDSLGLDWSLVNITNLTQGEEVSFLEAVIGAMQNTIETCDLPNSYHNYLKDLGIINSVSATTITTIILNELLGERNEFYKNLSNSVEFPVKVISDIEDPKYFYLVIAALSNVMNIAITIVPNVEKLPVFIYLPAETPVVHCSLFIAINKSGMFHTLKYDPVKGAIPKDHCRCGVNDKVKRRRCLLPRCPCYEAGRKCNSHCGCKGCENEKTEVSKLSSPRKRIRPTLSKINLKNSFAYAQQLIGDLKPTIIAPAQHYLLEACIYLLINEMKISHYKIEDQLLINLLIEEYDKFIENMKENPSSDTELQKSLQWIERDTITKWMSRRRKNIYLMESLLV